MKFLFDAHHLGLRHTGNETWCANIVRHLDSALGDDDVEYATTAQGATVISRLTDRPVHLISASSWRRLAIDLPRLVRRLRPDAIFTQYTMVPARVNAVVMIHDLSYLDSQARQWAPWRSRFRFRISADTSARFARRIIVPSNFTKHQLTARYGLDSASLILAPNAVDPDLAAELDGVPRTPGGDFTVLSVGNVLPRKNLITVARAIKSQRDRGHHIRYRVVGQVPRDGTACARELQRILPDIEITGFVTRSELAREYLSASVLAFPSLFEGYGIPIIEAMLARLPVLCSDTTSLPEVAAGGAIVLSPTRADRWQAAIAAIAHRPASVHPLIARGLTRARHLQWATSAQAVAGALRMAATAPVNAD